MEIIANYTIKCIFALYTTNLRIILKNIKGQAAIKMMQTSVKCFN
jgi:hypothetical protein